MSLYGPIAKLEEERRRRKIEDLNRRFEATIRNIDAIAKVNEEAYKAKKAVFEAAKRAVPEPPRKTEPIKKEKKKPVVSWATGIERPRKGKSRKP